MADKKEISIKIIPQIAMLAVKTAVGKYLKESKKIYIPGTEVA